jgi:hypothetical protein
MIVAAGPEEVALLFARAVPELIPELGARRRRFFRWLAESGDWRSLASVAATSKAAAAEALAAARVSCQVERRTDYVILEIGYADRLADWQTGRLADKLGSIESAISGLADEAFLPCLFAWGGRAAVHGARDGNLII